ncbi:hypothetical protein P8452_01523 [Trifolium repens]|jgi:hypothetical protein|nr:B3 domain-containing protein [Trifolium repens]WJX10848.1 hypothetical protein P8452_01523 [Trifolium repens]
MAHCNSYSCVADHVLTVGTNWDLSLKKRKIMKEKSDLGNGTNNDDAVWRNWEDWEYYLPIKKRKIKGRIGDYCEYDLPSKKRIIANKQETKKTCNVDDEWEIKKVLETSDVCRGLSRLLLKKELTQEFVIPVLLGGAKVAETNGVEVQVWDVDTKSPHSLVFKIWTSAKSHVFTTGWVKDFVLRRNLKKGDKIGLHWDQYNRRFNFSVI